MRASAKGIEYPSSLSGSNQGRRRSRPAAVREPASRANMICGGADTRDAVPPGPLARFLTIENPNGCLCHQRLSLDTPIRR